MHRIGSRVMIRDLTDESEYDVISRLYGKIGVVVEMYEYESPDAHCVIVCVNDMRISFHESELLEVYE